MCMCVYFAACYHAAGLQYGALIDGRQTNELEKPEVKKGRKG